MTKVFIQKCVVKQKGRFHKCGGGEDKVFGVNETEINVTRYDLIYRLPNAQTSLPPQTLQIVAIANSTTTQQHNNTTTQQHK